eukprot:107180-Pleurochrysis_carterae.AAC.4
MVCPRRASCACGELCVSTSLERALSSSAFGSGCGSAALQSGRSAWARALPMRFDRCTCSVPCM